MSSAGDTRAPTALPAIAVAAIATSTCRHRAAGGAHGQAASLQKGCPAATPGDFRSISRPEVESLIKDLDPKIIDGLKGDPERRQSQLANLRELMAFASQSLKDGLADDELICSELKNIRDEVTAGAYDKHLNKAKPAKGQ